ncbi:MAG: PTS glucose transporter subunit IIA [Erysipelotrichaceae bacterium]|nr:PTS glucose transporter subunit IIA [Erysipelotrichaceae bacterium]
MGLFDKLFKKEAEVVLPDVNASDEDIVALADGQLIDITTVPDPVFSEQMMGKSTAFKYESDKVILCSPANGTLAVLFPTGHAFGIQMNNGVELLVHCGVDTVNAKGEGFRLLSKKQGDTVKAGDPIVEVDIRKLSASYDMSTMLIITNPNDQEYEFLDPQPVVRGEKVTK